MAAIDRAADADPWLAEHPPEIEWFSGQFAAAETPVDHQLTRTIHAAHLATTGLQLVIDAATYGADMRHFTNFGQIPCLMYGPGNVRKAHRPDEYVPVSEVLAVARTLAVALSAWCGPGNS